jgi:hypothetical protein
MILNGIAASKQSKGLTMQADYAKSKIPVKAKAPENVVVPAETLQKYTGEYYLGEETVQVKMKEGKTLTLTIPEQPEMELTPVSTNKFAVKYMDGYSIEFTSGDKGEITGFTLTTPGGEEKATKKK